VLLTHAVLATLMLAAWIVVRQGHRGTARLALGAALLFRLAASPGDPMLSDDVHRYVWDGKVQLHGVHPYRFAPDDPELAALRDNNWELVNHPELPTIYPPLAQVVFLVLTATGGGVVGFKLAFGLLDFGVVLALRRLLQARGLPEHRWVLYAWNPLAVLETAGSGHLEPLGVLLTVLAVTCLVATPRRVWSAPLALAAAIQTKLLPAVLAAAVSRRTGLVGAAVLAGTVVLLGVPYALTGPAVGGGLFAYANNWERNAIVFPAVRAGAERSGLDTVVERGIDLARDRFGVGHGLESGMRRLAWPGTLARFGVAVLALGWIAWINLKARPDPVREALWVIGGVLLLSPTVHPWYLLWVLPFAAALASPGWLLLCGTVCLAYSVPEGDVPWLVRGVEYAIPLTLIAREAMRSLAVRRTD
jgi:hypothetical protein